MIPSLVVNAHEGLEVSGGHWRSPSEDWMASKPNAVPYTCQKPQCSKKESQRALLQEFQERNDHVASDGDSQAGTRGQM